MTKLNSYETLYIVKPDLTEDSLSKLIESYQGLLLERGAKNIITQNRGRRTLKYIIKKYKDAHYVQMNYDGNGEVIQLLERAMKINENVVRFLTTAV